MILAIDIGNTAVKLGLFDGQGLQTRRIPTHPIAGNPSYIESIAEFLKTFSMDKILEGCIISSVVPSIMPEIAKAVFYITGAEPLTVTANTAGGLRIEIENPEALGADRIASAVGALKLFGPPVAVIDFGTATTVNFLDTNGTFIGGAILPGLGLMSKSLGTETARLPEVEIAEPNRAIAKETESAILAGIILGTAGAVQNIVSTAEAESGCCFKIVLTGGYSGLMHKHISRVAAVEPELTLRGLKYIYEEQV